jgi:hypothetical protein
MEMLSGSAGIAGLGIAVFAASGGVSGLLEPQPASATARHTPATPAIEQ